MNKNDMAISLKAIISIEEYFFGPVSEKTFEALFPGQPVLFVMNFNALWSRMLCRTYSEDCCGTGNLIYDLIYDKRSNQHVSSYGKEMDVKVSMPVGRPLSKHVHT